MTRRLVPGRRTVDEYGPFLVYCPNCGGPATLYPAYGNRPKPIGICGRCMGVATRPPSTEFPTREEWECGEAVKEDGS